MNEQQLNNEGREQEQTKENAPLILDEQQSQQQPVGNAFDTLFEGNDSSYNGNQQLSKTARLTQLANNIANEVFEKASADDANADKVQASTTSHDAMDDLINEFYNLGSVDVDFLKSLDDEEIEKMIRSQQSKRSRAKSKAMTRENYMTMMVGAIAENLLRIAGNKPKSSGGASMGSIGYTDEDLQALADYPEELKKAIRNVQSKKSIMKSKADFDASSPRWQQLLQVEQELKAMRDNTNAKASKEAQEALDRQQKINEMLQDANASDDPVKAAEMLESIKNMLASN